MKVAAEFTSRVAGDDGDDEAAPVEAQAHDAALNEALIEVQIFGAGERQHGQRLDLGLAGWLPGLSRSYLQQLTLAGLVAVDGRTVLKPATKLQAGQQVRIELRPSLQSQAFTPQAVDFKVVHTDEHLLVIDKPVGLVVHPAAGHWTHTLLNGLLHAYPASSGLPRAGIVHRLDKDTSGLMMVARSRTAMDALVQMISRRDVHRQYLALSQACWQGPGERRVDAAIGRDPRNRLRMAVVDPQLHSGKNAITDFRLLQGHERASLLECTLHTGRTHQIRVHAASIGHPLAGDALYGGSQGWIERQALHAARLRLCHPISQEPLEFGSAPPPDFAQALERASLRYTFHTDGD